MGLVASARPKGKGTVIQVHDLERGLQARGMDVDRETLDDLIVELGAGERA
jgi:hypothetical protein